VRARLSDARYRRVSGVLLDGTRTILDVGCRDAVLRRSLRPDIHYVGLDRFPGPGVDCVCDVEMGIPFRARSFDAVAALDILEHTDNIWFVFDELVRAARRQVIVILPNLYHWSLRLQYLRGREMDKYALPHEPIRDRHRWLTSYQRASTFCRSMAARHGLTLSEHVFFNVRRTLPVDAALSLLSKNLGAWAVMYVFALPPGRRSGTGNP
jgi:Methionine biosynthesis protein MetW